MSRKGLPRTITVRVETMAVHAAKDHLLEALSARAVLTAYAITTLRERRVR